jgi:hypothetical protein
MKKENKPNGAATVTSQAISEDEITPANLLARMEQHLAQAIKVHWAVLRTLQKLDVSVEILAAQKNRELDEKHDAESC